MRTFLQNHGRPALIFGVEVRGDQLVTFQGPAGSRLKERTIACPDAATAERRGATLVRQRLAEGYSPAGQARPTSFDRAPELEAVLARTPDDEPTRLVYADWLLSRGELLGDLILTELQWERTGEQRLLGRLGRLRRQCAGNVADRHDLRLIWRGGTVHRLIVRRPSTVLPDLAHILSLPALATLGVVEIQSAHSSTTLSPQPLIDHLAELAPAVVRKVDLRHLGPSISPPSVVARLGPLTALPRFRAVGLDLNHGHQVGLPYPRIAELSLVVRSLGFVDRLIAQRWPRLERLVLRHEAGYRRLGQRVLRALPDLDAPALRTIELQRFDLPHEGIATFLRSPLGRRIKTLDLTLSNVDQRLLRRLATRSAHVRRVVRRTKRSSRA
ncbi:MAG: hypothetical protein AAGA48_26370 [Myxococcota bacterium]